MRVTMVGHASVVVDHDGLAIWTDPWLSGEAFNQGWSIHPQPVIDDALRASVTHLWISHEHPDHLSIPTLKAMSAQQRAGRTVLYQRHLSAEVVGWLRRQGFARVIELTHGRWYRLSRDLRVRSDQVGHEDSAMTWQGGGRTVVNLNDCKPPSRTLRRLVDQVGPVDLLLDQFSIAGWAGNPGDLAAHAAHADAAREVFFHHLDVVQPRAVLPFASFMRFSHVDNAYLNHAGVALDDIARRVPADQLVVLAPGQHLDLAGSPGDRAAPRDPIVTHDPAPGLATYRRARREVDELPLARSSSVGFEEVLAAAQERMADLGTAYPQLVLRRLAPVTFVASDLGRALRVHPVEGAQEVALAEAGPAVWATSDVVAHTFRFRFGLATLLISGRFTLDAGAAPAFDRLKQLGAAYGSGFVTRGLAGRVRQRRVREFVTRRWRDVYPQFIAKAVG